MLFRSVVAIAAIAIGVTAAMAQQDPIAARKALMKNMGAQSGQAAKFLKGEVDTTSLTDKMVEKIRSQYDVAVNSRKLGQLFDSL